MLKVRSSFYLQGLCVLLLKLELLCRVINCPLTLPALLGQSTPNIFAFNCPQPCALLSLSQALAWVKPHVAQPVLFCAQNTVRQLRGLQQIKVHNARLKAHTVVLQVFSRNQLAENPLIRLTLGTRAESTGFGAKVRRTMAK
jgi:hypothetical protein